MISFFRSIFNTKLGGVLALAFIALIAVAFALSDVSGSGSFGGVSSGNVARVGDENIPVSDLRSTMQTRLRNERRQNPTLDMAKMIEGGALTSTLDSIIASYALQQLGEKYGMGVSKRLIDSEINQIDQVKGLDGQFSAEAFQAFLRNIELSEGDFRKRIEQELYGKQIMSVSTKGLKAPKTLVLPYASLLLEKRSGNLAVVPSAAFLPKDQPSEVQLSKYYKDNASKFTIPEKRAVSYAIFDKEAIAEQAKPSKDDIATYYKNNADEFAASETRDFDQVIVATEPAAKALAEKISGGQSMQAAAQSAGLSVTNNAGISKTVLTSSASKAVADSVFAAENGKVATPVRGGLGWYVVRVKNVTATPARSLDEVSDEIAKTLEASNSEEMLAELTSEIEDALSDGQSIKDVAAANKFKVETTPKLFANGSNPSDRNYKPIPEMQRILPAAFELTEDSDAQLIELIPGQQFAIVDLAELEAAAPPPLAEVKDLVIRSWALSEGSKKAKAVADKIAKEVTSGKGLKEALANAGTKLPPMQTVSGTRAELNKDGQPLAPPLALLFSMKKGTAKSLAAPGDNGFFIVQANEVIRGDASKDEESLKRRQAEFTRVLAQEYQSQLIRAAMADVGVERNEEAIATLRTQLIDPNGGQ